MSEDVRKKAIEMLLSGATLLSEPCPYCKGVRVMKDGICAANAGPTVDASIITASDATKIPTRDT